MCKLTCSIVTAVIGCVLVIGSSLVGFLVVPNLVESIIKNFMFGEHNETVMNDDECEVILYDDTIQYERFEEVPFPLTFNLRVFTLVNHEEVLTGAVPIMEEVGPYVYKLYQSRNITYAAEDILRYRRIDHFQFDAEASFPLTEDDVVNIINVPYHAIIQIAQMSFPNLVSVLNVAMGSVFGEYNSPVMRVRVGDLFFDGIRICANPGLLGSVACSVIRRIGADAQNLVEQEDGSLVFSLLSYRNGYPSIEYEVLRGTADSSQLGVIRTMGDLPHFLYWVDEAEGMPGRCNMINGTDAGIFMPFVDRDKSLYAINTDICRSVELRYQYDVEIDGIPAAHFSANEWFLDNNEGCFCLNVTEGINSDDGCLLSGAMELYTCVGLRASCTSERVITPRPDSPTAGPSAEPVPQPLTESAPATAPEPNFATELELGEEILSLLGEAPKAKTPLGKNIHKEIASRWQEILRNGLSSEAKQKICQEYLVPANCDLLVAPVLNPEAKAALTDFIVKRDASLQQKQQQIGTALAALSQATELLVSKETPEKVLKPLSDACRLLCDSHYADTKTRRNFVISAVKPDLKDTLVNTTRNQLLFGENLNEQIKSAKNIQKTGEGALLVLTYPHFMYADMRYRNGVVGMTPRELDHRLFIEIEPNTGTPIRGAKRAQFNIFQRPISSVPATRDLHTALVPIVWVEEAIDLEDEYKDELRNRLLRPLNLLDILIPVLIAACCGVLVVGLGCVWRAKRLRKPAEPTASKE